MIARDHFDVFDIDTGERLTFAEDLNRDTPEDHSYSVGDLPASDQEEGEPNE